MKVDQRTVIKEAVRRYLEDEQPDRLEEFDVVFDDVYRVIRSRVDTEAESHSADRSDDGEGIPFDLGALQGNTITVACWIGMYLLIGTLKYTGKHFTKKAIEKTADDLVKHGAKASIVDTLKDIFSGILAEL